MDKDIKPTEEEKKKKGIGAFIKKNKVRLSAAALALVLGCGAAVGIHIHNQKDNADGPDSSMETLDPDHTPDSSHNIVIGGDVIGTVDPENPIVKPGEPEPSGDIEFEVPGSHENEGNTPKPETELPSSRPEIKDPNTGNGNIDPDPVESHLFHTFTEWTNDVEANAETRTCTVCGIKETREHSLNPMKTNYYTATLHNDNENGTHYKVQTQTCSTCDYVWTNTVKEDCTYGKVTYDDTYHYQSCTECGQSFKLKHTLDHGKLNKDGSTTYSCTYEGCNYTKTIEHTNRPVEPSTPTHRHSYEKTSVLEDLQNGQHRISVYDVCSCGARKFVSSNTYNCSYGTPQTTYTNLGESGHSYTTTNTCTVCGHKDIHQGNEVHHTTTTTNSNGDTVITCDECTYKKVIEKEKPPVPGHVHDYEEKTETVYAGNDQHTTTIYNVCKDPNCTGDDKKVQISQVSANCTYGAATTTYEVSESGHIVVTTRVCSGCGHKDIQKSASVAHSHTIDTGRVDANGDKIFACVCGHEKSISQSCTHTWGTPQTTYEQIDGSSHKVIITHTCTECGTAEQVSETTAPCSHDITEVGLTKTDACGTCGYVHSTHTHVKDVHTTAGDDTYCHYEEVICAECGEVLTPKHGTETHTWEDYGDPVGPYQPTICTKCGKESKRLAVQIPTNSQEPSTGNTTGTEPGGTATNTSTSTEGTEQTEYVPPLQEGTDGQQTGSDDTKEKELEKTNGESQDEEFTNAADQTGKQHDTEGNGIPEGQQPEGEPSPQAEEEEIIEEEIEIAGKTFVYTPTRHYHY